MGSQLELLFHAMRKGFEANVRSALNAMDVARKQDLSSIKQKMDQLITKKEVRVLQEKLDQLAQNLKRVETIEPYISALEDLARGQEPKKTRTKKKRGKSSGTSSRRGAPKKKASKRRGTRKST